MLPESSPLPVLQISSMQMDAADLYAMSVGGVVRWSLAPMQLSLLSVGHNEGMKRHLFNLRS